MADVKQKRDWQTPALLAIGATGLGAGLYFFLKKPPGVDPGDIVLAQFEFDYLGPAGDYVLSVRFGDWKPWYLPFGFDPYPELEFTGLITVPGPGTHEFDLECVIPEFGIRARTFDAEAALLLPGTTIEDGWIEGTRIYKESAIKVR